MTEGRAGFGHECASEDSYQLRALSMLLFPRG
jgi:hypothetical protein